MTEAGPKTPLRTGWTTGACATAATRAALRALRGEPFPDPVVIRLPRGETPSFPLVLAERGEGWARAGVIKDAGDDPDVTHGATILATVRHGPPGGGVTFRAGPGVGTVTRPGLPLAEGEPAINPVPRRMMTAEVVEALGPDADLEIEISVPGGERLAQATWNPRLGILGGISILGTTGVVVPYSCSAWIHSIQSGIDVARASGLAHVAGCAGSTSEKAVLAHHRLPPEAVIDMGDFAGGMLKYLRRHPLPRLTIAGGFAKMSKLAAGHLDLHSGRSQVDKARLAALIGRLGGSPDLVNAAAAAGTGLEILDLATRHGLLLAEAVADQAAEMARSVLDGAPIAVDVVVVDRQGRVVGTTSPR